MTFEAFTKIARLSREMVITEKLDGTNAQIFIPEAIEHVAAEPVATLAAGWIFAGSRSRFITPENDNFGFAKWVRDNAEELLKLGPGRHFGEWYGLGIQRGYGLNERRFALFNTSRWGDPAARPACCGCVPVLYEGDFDTNRIAAEMTLLAALGSKAAPGFMKPEGVVVYHKHANVLFKKTFENDAKGKGHGA